MVTHTYTHDNYYNPRCAHAHQGLMTTSAYSIRLQGRRIPWLKDSVPIPGVVHGFRGGDMIVVGKERGCKWERRRSKCMVEVLS